jgi:hypothetical protein
MLRITVLRDELCLRPFVIIAMVEELPMKKISILAMNVVDTVSRFVMVISYITLPTLRSTK